MTDPAAEEYKKKGNDAFKAGNWDEAIKMYNKAITTDPDQASYYSNRSACWASKGNHQSALGDANKCIERDPDFVKGYSRKGKALLDLGKPDEAEAAFKEGLVVEPGNLACSQGVAAVQAAKKATGGGGFNLGGLLSGGGIGEQVRTMASKLQSGGLGGRFQMYLVIMACYFVYGNYIRGPKDKGGKDESSHQTSDEADDLESDGAAGALVLRRGFTEVGSCWLSTMEAKGKKIDTHLVMLHRTASSAEAEFGHAVAPEGQRLGAKEPPHPGPRPTVPWFFTLPSWWQTG